MFLLNSILTSFAVLLLLATGCSRNPKERGYEVLPDMVHSVPYDAFSENPNTKDGLTNQSPVEGSVPRHHLPFRYGVGEAEAIRAGQELKNPYPTTAASVARGKEAFGSWCLPCHGETGGGDGPLIPKFPNPPTFSSARVKAFPEGRIYHVIMKGFNDMPSHSQQIDEKDRWYIVQFVQTLQGNQAPKN